MFQPRTHRIIHQAVSKICARSSGLNQKVNTIHSTDWNLHDRLPKTEQSMDSFGNIVRPRFRTTISVKVGGLALMLLVSLMAVGAFSYYQMSQIGEDINLVAKSDLTITERASNILRLSFAQEKLRTSMVQLYTQRRMSNFEQAVEDSKIVAGQITDQLTAMNSVIANTEGAGVHPRYSELDHMMVELGLQAEQIDEETDKFVNNLRADERTSASEAVQDLNELVDEINLTVTDITEEVRRLTEDSAANAQSRQRTGTTAIVIVAIVALWIGGAVSWFLVRQLTNSVHAVSDRARSIENSVGTDDFVHEAIEVKSSDEVGDLAAAFNEMSSSLERNIEQRRRYESELSEARDEAELANQAKSKFLATISHELRTPLNAIIGYSEMLEEEAEELQQDELVPDLQKINSAGRHLLELINSVLDLSKIEAGHMDVFVEEFDLTNEFSEIVSVVGPLVEKNSNSFEQKIAPDIGTMRGDSTKIRQAVINLLSNAAKFTSEGSVTLVADRFEKDREAWVRVEVVDTGIGMTDEQLDRVFQEFTQADSSISRRFEGTGLGLTLSRRFCQLMGGDISVTSKFGIGTTFTIELPLDTEKYIPADMLSSN